MAFQSHVPPHGSAQAPTRDHAPPDDPAPNAALLKADIDSGRTGDKTEVFDPGMAMLGTCEEAAGTPLTTEQLRTARLEETKRRWGGTAPGRTGGAHDKRDKGVLYAFVALIGLIGAGLVASLAWLG